MSSPFATASIRYPAGSAIAFGSSARGGLKLVCPPPCDDRIAKHAWSDASAAIVTVCLKRGIGDRRATVRTDGTVADVLHQPCQAFDALCVDDATSRQEGGRARRRSVCIQWPSAITVTHTKWSCERTRP